MFVGVVIRCGGKNFHFNVKIILILMLLWMKEKHKFLVKILPTSFSIGWWRRRQAVVVEETIDGGGSGVADTKDNI